MPDDETPDGCAAATGCLILTALTIVVFIGVAAAVKVFLWIVRF